MSVPLNGRVAAVEPEIIQSLNTPFVKRCRCGRNWNVTMERGESGQAGCVRCLCDAELVSWSGTVVFNAVPGDPD